MDELEVMEAYCKETDINPNEGIYVIRGEILARAILRGNEITPNQFRVLYNEAKIAIHTIMLYEEMVLSTLVVAAIELAEEHIREATQHPEETA